MENSNDYNKSLAELSREAGAAGLAVLRGKGDIQVALAGTRFVMAKVAVGNLAVKFQKIGVSIKEYGIVVPKRKVIKLKKSKSACQLRNAPMPGRVSRAS